MLSDTSIHDLYLYLWSQLNDPNVPIPSAIDQFTIPINNTYPVASSFSTTTQDFAYATLMSGNTYTAGFSYINDGTHTITFTNTTTFVASTITWNFGDNTTSTATSPTHTYSHAGTYTVTMTTTHYTVTQSVVVT
jgi:PKD repeat protein